MLIDLQEENDELNKQIDADEELVRSATKTGKARRFDAPKEGALVKKMRHSVMDGSIRNFAMS